MVEMFLLGVTSSFSQCLLCYFPVIFPYLIATKRDLKSTLKSISIFLFTGLICYTLLGAFTSLFSQKLFSILKSYKVWIYIAGGGFITFLSLLLIFGKEIKICKIKLRQKEFSNLDFVLLGIFFSILPCIPLFCLLTYILLKGKSFLDGALLGFLFGSGRFISPLFVFSFVPRLLKKTLLLSRICGFVMLVIGLNLIFSQLL